MMKKVKKNSCSWELPGKSTTSADAFQILLDAGLEPSIISGAGLTK